MTAPLTPTVVIITHNRCSELLATLSRLSELPERPPVMVVDNGSTDRSAASVRASFPQHVVLDLGANFGAAARNIGVRLASTPLVAFCDDDTWWAPGSLQRATELFAAHPRLAVATAEIVVEPEGSVDSICDEMAASPLPRPYGVPGAPLLSFLAGASVIRRSAFFGAGGFCPHLLIGGEEELLGTDLVDGGWIMAYTPELRIHHQASALRDPHLRRRQGIRNTLWHGWMRRPHRSSLRRSAALIRRLPPDLTSVRAVAEAAAGLPWVLASRRTVRTEVETGLRALEAGQMTSKARRYVS